MGNIRPFWRSVQRGAKYIKKTVNDMKRIPKPSPRREDQILSGLIVALMLILVWFLILIFH